MVTLRILGEDVWEYECERGEMTKLELLQLFLEDTKEALDELKTLSHTEVQENFWDYYPIMEADNRIERVREKYNLDWHKKQRHDKYKTFFDFFLDSKNTTIVWS